ncbi:hypothetical protein JK358_04725 [Nocardia sp. 2]|uniref:Uncharacterized protein n=1 Tax=Nocardia acididurans TaxID=2802282 RepID=A0ABS1M0G0_9NOCA|nr:hypothetical protein [Nocardia acididurans]MBL1073690.1 hypothetical protein [Nocardia acididurans]
MPNYSKVLVFTYEDGRPVHPNSIREGFKRLTDRAASYMLGRRETPATAQHP